MKRSGAATNNIPTHVAAGMELESEIIPVVIAPTIPPISNTIESSALASGDKEAKIEKENCNSTSCVMLIPLTCVFNVEWQPEEECVVNQLREKQAQ